LAANKIYTPSYISLESALSYYGFIPELVSGITSVSTKKSQKFNTAIGAYRYQRIKPGLFWGFQLVDHGVWRIKLAEPEKALMDFFYLHAHCDNLNEISEMRFNKALINEAISLTGLQQYAQAFKNTALTKRVKLFMEYLQHD
jgi:predicted transcriptional regulator of viral defense system